MRLKERKEFIAVLRVLWEQEFTGHSKVVFSTLVPDFVARKHEETVRLRKRLRDLDW